MPAKHGLEDVDEPPLAKKPKLNGSTTDSKAEKPVAKAASLVDTPDASTDVHNDSTEVMEILPPNLAHLTTKYNFAVVRVKKNSKLDNRVKVLVQHLSKFDFMDKNSKPGIAVLDARSNDSGKLISITEIAKREIGEMRSGKWYQYSRLSSELISIPRLKKSTKTAVEKDNVTDIGNDIQGVRADNDTKLRAVPILITYLSRVSIPEFKEAFGEQTNDTTKQ